jgi:hypothetical protein
VITNADQLLTAEPDRELSILVSVLDRAGGEWALPIAWNQPWDPAAPFQVLFTATGSATDLRSRLDQAGGQVGTLVL